MIRLIHPDGKIERLRWTDQHPASSYGLGVILRGHGPDILDGAGFKWLAAQGARIECTDERERRRVAGALAWGALGLDDGILKINGGTNMKNNKMDRNGLADELLNGCPAESLSDHKKIAGAIRGGKSVDEILAMRETNDWPSTYDWLKSKMGDMV